MSTPRSAGTIIGALRRGLHVSRLVPSHLGYAVARRRVCLLAGLLAAVGAGAALAQTAPARPPGGPDPKAVPQAPPQVALQQLADQLDRTPDKVVATVSGTPITFGMLSDEIRGLPPIWGTAPAKTIVDFALSDLIQMRILAAKARQQGIEKDPKVQRKVARVTDIALINALLQTAAAGKVTPAAIKQRYDQVYAGKPGPEEVWVRVIATGSEAEANDALKKIREGMDFASAVREFSHDPSKDAGGDLGYVTAEQMPPTLASVAFALSPGEISAVPLQVDNLWYIVEVEGRRQRGSYSLEEATPKLRADLTKAAVVDYLKNLKDSAEVKVYGITGAPDASPDKPQPK